MDDTVLLEFVIIIIKYTHILTDDKYSKYIISGEVFVIHRWFRCGLYGIQFNGTESIKEGWSSV